MAVILKPEFAGLRKCTTFQAMADWIKGNPRPFLINIGVPEEEMEEEFLFAQFQLLRREIYTLVAPMWNGKLVVGLPTRFFDYIDSCLDGPKKFVEGTGMIADSATRSAYGVTSDRSMAVIRAAVAIRETEFQHMAVYLRMVGRPLDVVEGQHIFGSGGFFGDIGELETD